MKDLNYEIIVLEDSQHYKIMSFWKHSKIH